MAAALKNLTLTDMGIGLQSMAVIANFDWQNFVFTSGANYLTAYNTWINPPAGITYNAGGNISVRVEYVYGNRIGLRLTPDTGAAANFKVYELLCVGAAGSRVFTFNQDWNSAIPVPISGGGTGGKTAAEALTNLGLGDAATKDVGTTPGTVAAGDDPRFLTGWTYGGNKARGWRKDPQGNIEQWGTDPATNGIVAVVTMPIPFPSASFIVNANPLAATISGSGEANNRFYPTSASTFEIRSGTAGTYGFMWNARG
ncbi:gp53-like domain-containing protein [Yersinia mollaretii]|uniref:gp53-like domain-containing protein n=1 Tax=Yersinia mollaretii TaxID=33060 RepID=UPI003BB706DF